MKMNHQAPSASSADKVLCLAIPLISLVVAGCCFWTIGASELKTAEMLLMGASALIAFGVGLWYIFAALYLLLTRSTRSAAQSLPRWVPRMMRNVAIGTLGISVYAAPATAAPLTSASSPSIATVHETHPSSLEQFYGHADDLSDSQKDSLSSFFTSHHATADHGSATPATTRWQGQSDQQFENLNTPPQQWLEVDPQTFKHASAHQTPSINPFFTASSREDLSERSVGMLHTVRSGETLWSIATNYLPSGSPDAEIMEYVSAIYAANSHQLPVDANLIYAGQQLILPFQ
ncbi:LysM peptidoglycan-binding domain-containing protein [Rothia sp. ZJ932]|uniref:LysM peptidoglycan-binding domain-containing protein n=1 Tax=Rothia sp. ZJ932 TaxID=2810516 RepID=UPI00196804E1|nr:LysM domain-containing protein [Rothia sp. ZJ932]QRZ61017.1 LysM peptidoglycan-binding domain-containing protein [Rothia sp. ZJ932]